MLLRSCTDMADEVTQTDKTHVRLRPIAHYVLKHRFSSGMSVVIQDSAAPPDLQGFAARQLVLIFVASCQKHAPSGIELILFLMPDTWY